MGLVGTVLVVPASPAAAISGSEFDPAFIISDRNFFNSGAMSQAQIQSFLQQQQARCTAGNGQPCLKDYRTLSTTKPAAATGHCAAYRGSSSELASEIIYKVAQACGINPQVLIVTLQKEQALITSLAPTATKYKIAMGFGCPDTAACDTAYYGFFNQVYKAAWQFRQYTFSPSGWRYRIGQTAVQFHPNTACGSTTVNIRNQATANLYNYTPYQPNGAALAKPTGSGDACSSYGNRNFWHYYYSWFGNPALSENLFASVDGATLQYSSSGGEIALRGWAFDPARPADVIQVHAWTYAPDGSSSALSMTADQSREDIGAAYPAAGAAHGYSGSVKTTMAGGYRTCLYAIRSGGAVLVECFNFVVTQAAPLGRMDDASVALSGSTASVTVRGWAIDAVKPSTPIQAHLHLIAPDGSVSITSITANASRPDVGAVYPSAGPSHGFTATVPITKQGAYKACVFAIGTRVVGENNRLLECRSLQFGPSAPTGRFDAAAIHVAGSAATLVASGWSFDQGLVAYTNSVRVAITAPSGRVTSTTVTAGNARADVARVFPAAGALHGFTSSFGITETGRYSVCATSLGHGVLGSSSSPMGCRTLVFGPSNPTGVLDGAAISLSGATATLGYRGWALDGGLTSPSSLVQIEVTAPGGILTTSTLTASDARADIAAAVLGAGSAHGFSGSVPITAVGTYRVCATAIGLSVFPDRRVPLGCRSVAFGPSAPLGSVDAVSRSGSVIVASGWAFDSALPTRSSEVIVEATGPNGTLSTRVAASSSRPDVAAVHRAAGPLHGFTATVPVSVAGSYSVCSFALGDAAFGSPRTALGCRTVVVP